jgi:hypothetical protein
MHRIISVLLLVPCLAAGPNSATADWAVVESLAVGERIQVELSIGKSVNGKIDHVTPEAVFVQHGSQTTEIRRHEVNRLYRQKSGAGAKWAAIGALIGAGAGVGGGAATMEKEKGYEGAVAGTVALGGLLGAGVGYLLGRGKSVLVYNAASQKR